MVTRSIASGVKGRARLSILRLHRLIEFEHAFNLYLEGKVSAERVKVRATKMLEVGLPKLR